MTSTTGRGSRSLPTGASVPAATAPQPADYVIRKIRRGARVETTGLGKTRTWGRFTGKVVSVRRGSIFVQWDNSFVEDQMFVTEVREIAS